MTRSATTSGATGGVSAAARRVVAGFLFIAIGTAAAQDDGSPGAAGALADGEPTIETLRNARDVLIGVEDFAAALDPATRVVDAIEAAGDDPALGADLIRLGQVQAGLGEHDDAEETYLRAVEALTESGGATSPALADAYLGLGRNYLNDRRFDEALIAFEEARAINRRSEGLFNSEQAAILDEMTMAHLGIGDTLTAKALQTERLDNAIRLYGPDDARVIPFHAHLGDYLDNSRLRVGARAQYARALEISETTYGAVSPESLALLRRLAEIDLLLDRESDVPAQLETTLGELDTVNPVERARTLLTLGDHALVRDGMAAAAPRYRQAWDVLDALEGVDAAAVFATPRPLNLIPPLSAVDRGARSDPWAWGELVLSFDVSAEGRASNVEVVSMMPRNDGLADDYSRRIREAHFRPRLVDGDAKGTADVRYQQNFRYYVRD